MSRRMAGNGYNRVVEPLSMKTEDIPCVSVRDVVGESGAGNGLLHFKAKGCVKGIGIDGYNQTITGEVSMTLRSKVADNEHIPLVIQARRKRVER